MIRYVLLSVARALSVPRPAGATHVITGGNIEAADIRTSSSLPPHTSESSAVSFLPSRSKIARMRSSRPRSMSRRRLSRR